MGIQALVAVDPSLRMGHLRDFLGMSLDTDCSAMQSVSGKHAIAEDDQYKAEDASEDATTLFSWGGTAAAIGEIMIVRKDPETGCIARVHDVASTATGSFESNFSNNCE